MTKAEFKSRINISAKYILKQMDLKRSDIVINHRLPTVAIGEYSFFAQGDDAQSIIDDLPDWVDERNALVWYLDSAGAI